MTLLTRLCLKSSNIIEPNIISIFLQFRSTIDTSCCYCEASSETVGHLFWVYPFAQSFWNVYCTKLIGFYINDIYP